MKRILTIAFVLFTGLVVRGQLYDAQWALGDEESVLDFRSIDSVKIDSLPSLIFYTYTNASICDEQGNLLYYTNGIRICSLYDSVLNGGGLSPCPYTDMCATAGLNIPQAALFLPKPGNTRYYYLFHFSNDTLSQSRPGIIYYSLVDRAGNNGLGEVIGKNIPLLSNVILRGGGMTACKHANGRDYWLVMGASGTNGFYKFLITPDSILGPFIQNIGPNFPLPYDLAYSKFSQDGSKFSTGAVVGPIIVMDFDRCNGEFSNSLNIYHIISDTGQPALNGMAGVEFSSNSEFLYVSSSNDLTQYDLWSANIQDSVELYKYTIDTNVFYGLDYLQIAPNGKIYSCTWNGGLNALHVINNPNAKGISAGFVYAGQPTYTINSTNLPNLINYKLGPLMGSGCDTITAGVPETKTQNSEPRVIPNPADKYAYVEMGMQGNYEFELLNEAGQLIDKKQTRQVDIFDTEHLASGVYFLRVVDRDSGKEVVSRKMVVVH